MLFKNNKITVTLGDQNQIKYFIILAVLRHSVYRVDGPISESLRLGNTAPFEEMSQRWRAVSNTASDLTSPRFETRNLRSRNESVTARLTGRYD